MNKNTFLLSLALIMLASGVITFIYTSNNHSECETTTVFTLGDNGEKTTTTTHNCKEKYNL